MNIMRSVAVSLVIGLLAASGAAAGEPTMLARAPGETVLLLTGSPMVDLVGQDRLWDQPFGGDTVQGIAVPSHKSPWLAAGLSVLVPGAGEFYAQSYWKAALFFALEVGLATAAIVYNNKGNNQTSYFQDYANQNWNVVSYAEYTETHLNPPNKPYNWRIPGTDGLPPWDQVNWAELNRMERDIGGYYSHTLPPYGEQQYYELIGKYPQFNQGWADAPPVFNYGDPVSQMLTYYSGERAKANTYYEHSSTMVALIVVNHILSALDAAWTTSNYNNALHARLEMRPVPLQGGFAVVPMMKVTYGF